LRGAAGVGLSTPELAVLLAYTKLAFKRDLEESGLCDDAWTAGIVADYFPTLMRERYADRMGDHQLRREIVNTTLTNEAFNRGGLAFPFRASEDTGASIADVMRGYVVAREVFGL